jgi:hypothetical protein
MRKRKSFCLNACQVLFFTTVFSLASEGHWAVANDTTGSSTLIDDGASPPQNIAPTPSGRGKHGGGKSKTQSSPTLAQGTISGSCNIIESPNNPFPGPCVNLMVVLNDSSGSEVFNTRTNSQGQFSFAAEPGKEYFVVSGSKYYSVVSPKGKVRGGETRVSLQLQQQ